MILKDIVDTLNLKVITGQESLDAEVTHGYSSDLMSDVIANSQKGDIWVTLQVHLNIVAVATMKQLAGIILINGRKPEDETAQRAKEEKLPILVSELPAFELIGRLYQLGITGILDA
jgi:serine kinase of HPr protein (carbohydrate metabolism regulator)